LIRSAGFGLLLVGSLLAGCGADPESSPAQTPDAGIAQTAAGPDAARAPAPLQVRKKLPEVLGASLTKASYDLEGLMEQGTLRVMVGYSRTHYFMDGLRIRGISAENLKQFDPFLQQQLGSPGPRINVLPVPVARDEMIDFVADGLGDMAIGNITVTEERAARVIFSTPLRRNVAELIVHGVNVSAPSDMDALSGRSVHVRASSSFRESIDALNSSFEERGLPPLDVVALDEHLQTEDILELVNAGVIDMTVADDHIAEFWADVHPNLVVRDDLVLAQDRKIAWAIRKELKDLKPIVDAFVSEHREGTLVGNVLLRRYLKKNRYVRNATATKDRRRLEELASVFQRYSDDYDFDWLLIAAQGYQESRLIQSRRSGAGAIGVMQLLPTTAAAPPIGIANIEELEANIHAGHKYLRHIADNYFDNPEMDELNRHLFSFAAYNAGPTRISRLRREAARRGLDPNVWFGQVERVVAERVGMEPVTYVRNIFKYYVTYTLSRVDEP
jgi:membrane-bound lytic murein transglycosylase MltF